MPFQRIVGFLDGPTLLDAWIQRCRISQAQAARNLGVSRHYLNQILSGERSPGLKNAVWIERMTGIVVEAWVSTEDGGLAKPAEKPASKPRVRKEITTEAAS